MPATTWMRPPSCCARATARPKKWKRRSPAWTPCSKASGATRLELSADETHRLRFWKGRKNAFPATGRISPDYMCMDSTIPRKRLAEILREIETLETKYRLRCVNVFHAGDGNLHPLILFDANDPDQLHRCELFGAEILETSVRLGGSVTGEHGVGVEKLNSMCVQFSAEEREQMLGIKYAFDPKGLLNPGKVIPSLQRCAEYGKMTVLRGLLPFPELPEVLMNTNDPALARLIDQVRAAHDARSGLDIRGGGTKAFYGETPTGEPLDTRALSGISSHEPTELVVTARAGTLLSLLQDALAEHGQCLPFDPPRFGAESTVGGMVAAGLAGPSRGASGSVRDHVLGITMLDGQGRVLTFGGPGHEERGGLRRIAPHGRLDGRARTDLRGVAEDPAQRALQRIARIRRGSGRRARHARALGRATLAIERRDLACGPTRRAPRGCPGCSACRVRAAGGRAARGR